MWILHILFSDATKSVFYFNISRGLRQLKDFIFGNRDGNHHKLQTFDDNKENRHEMVGSL